MLTCAILTASFQKKKYLFNRNILVLFSQTEDF